MNKLFNTIATCNRRSLFATLLGCALALCGTAYAAPGDLDPSFDGDGRVTTNIGPYGNTVEEAHAMAIQGDGKIVVAGQVSSQSTNGTGLDFALMRFNSDGSPDTSFGYLGAVVTDFGGDDVANAVAVQSDGKIIAAGKTSDIDSYFALARYKTDGKLDPTFGVGGKLVIQVARGFEAAYDLALQGDGKILVGGTAWPGGTGGFAYTDFALLRLLGNGQLDSGFGSGGKVLTDFAGRSDEIHGLAIMPNGKIVAGGNTAEAYPDFSPRTNFAVARYNANGSLDANFGTGGKVVVDFGSVQDNVQDIALQPNGKVVVVGYTSRSGTREDFALLRLNLDGTPDGTFGSGGKVYTDYRAATSNDRANSVAVQRDGKIVVAGSTTGNSPSGFAITRYLTDGTLDSTFSEGGSSTSNSIAQAVAIQSDDKIVVAGYPDIALARYNLDGSLDPGFDGDGRAKGALSRGSESICTVLAQRDGKLVAVGGSSLARYNSDGSLDSSFGDNGIAGAAFFDGTERITGAITAAALQADGKIVVVGYAMPIGFFYYGLIRFNTDGSRDSTFGNGGTVLYRPALEAFAHAVAIQADSKIVVAGDGNDNNDQIYTVARFNTDGSADAFPVNTPPGGGGSRIGFNAVAVQSDKKVVLAGEQGIVMRVGADGIRDAGFGTNGIAAVPFGSVLGIVVQIDGKIVATGQAYGSGDNSGFLVARLNNNGTLDTGFGANGVATADFGGSDNSYSVAPLPGGRTVVAGSTNVNGNLDFALAVFNANGVLDTSFGSGGKVVTPFGNLRADGDNEARSVAVQPNGRIVAAGYARPLFDTDFALARYFSQVEPIRMSIDDVQIVEGNSGNKAMAFHVSLTLPSTQKVSVDYKTAVPSYNAATPGVDYGAVAGTLTFAPGQSSKIIAVPIYGDTVDEIDEKFLVQLSSPVGATIADREGIGAIVNDDVAPNLSLSITGQTLKEGNSGLTPVTFNVRLSAPTGKAVTVQYKTENYTATAGSDYLAVPLTTLTFAPGETVKQIITQVKSDTVVELDERFDMKLSNAVGATIGRNIASGIILNDDGPGLTIDNAKTVTEGNSGVTEQTFTVHLSAASPNTVAVDWATEANTAGVADFEAASGTLTFAPGETSKTITVQIKGDTLVEGAETYKVNLSNPSYAVLADSQAIGYIRDDDSAPLLDEPSE